ncbi:MAG: ATP-dependent RNA helicase HrpA [Magnetococcales bacterium]|nr:ATP-dependent RNA helicase HrpA [Magnetococcales bacterium]
MPPEQQPRLKARLRRLRQRVRDGQPADRMLAELSAEFHIVRSRWESRLAQRPRPRFPEQLPVAARREEIAAAIRAHPVVILSGETGSGKTTQLPKICLEAGRGLEGLIGLTQPRRLAARSIAAYLARDLGGAVGEAVGCKVRFNDRVGPDCWIKVMTDGILLAETGSDPLLRAYDTLIIDEAHERSLNIDFLLGFLKKLQARRQGLKIIVSSATLDTKKFASHFDGAPIIDVAGRTWPVEVLYRPPAAESDEAEPDLERAVLAAVDELTAQEAGGDILVFLPGERDIRELAKSLAGHHPPQTRILPLYARLSAAEQQRIFEPTNRRTIVLATNVAETSLTVPGIRSVVDSGLARISRYSGRGGIQRLPVERISRASADQRMGRCGRLSAGLCIRLYSEEDYAARPLFAEPEILRSSLAAVILRMKDLKLDAVEDFPFVDPPRPAAVRDGLRLLEELGALDDRGALTPRGREMARLPIDPRLGRMILAARDHDALAEILVIAAALQVRDPRDDPPDRQQLARSVHARHRHPESDFLTLLNLWRFIQEGHREAQSKRQFSRFLKEHFLAPVRVREWEEVHGQLTRQIKESGQRINEVAADYEAIHKSLLAGLLGHAGLKTEAREFTGVRDLKFRLFPGSALFRKPPRWVVAAELVETGRLHARTCARVEPAWIEDVAGDLCRRSHFEPRWDRKKGRVVAWERVTFLGLPLVTRREVDYGPLDPLESRRIFIQSALVEGRLQTSAPFFHHNQQLLQELRDLEQRTRRRNLLVDDAVLQEFFEERIPTSIHTARAFDHWRRMIEKQDPHHLFLTREQVLQEASSCPNGDDFPGHLTVLGEELPLEYHFNPGDQGDGVSVLVPLPLLPRLPPEPFQWLVPGLLRAKVLALLKSLPKSLRKHLVPIPRTVERCLATPLEGHAVLTTALADRLQRLLGVVIPGEAWRSTPLPAHLEMNFKVVEPGRERVLAQGRDLTLLQQGLDQQARQTLRERPPSAWEREGLTRWDFGPIPERLALTGGTVPVHGYPALRDDGATVATVLADSPETARRLTRAGLRRLFLLHMPEEVRQARKSLPLSRQTCLANAALGPCAALYNDLLLATADRLFLGRTGDEDQDIRNPDQFLDRLSSRRDEFLAGVAQQRELVAAVFSEHHAINQLLEPAVKGIWLDIHRDIREQLDHLVYPGFLLATGGGQPWHYPRYFRAIRIRLERSRLQPGKDRERAAQLAPFWLAWREKQAGNARKGRHDPALDRFRWLLEEFRVSLFAQELGTNTPISIQRLRKAWTEID